MSPQTDGEEILKEIVEGLEGVSAGGWEYGRIKKVGRYGCYFSFTLMDADGDSIADAINTEVSEIVFEDDEYGGQSVDQLAFTNFRHLARCSPDNIRAVADYVTALAAERDAAKDREVKLVSVLSEQTELVDRLLTIVDGIEQDVGCGHPDKIWPLLGPVNDRAKTLLTGARHCETRPEQKPVPPLREGYVRKGGRNPTTSIIERPLAAAGVRSQQNPSADEEGDSNDG